jgi:hypothetical protein
MSARRVMASLALALAVAVVPEVAEGQVGGLVKKARDRVAGAGQQQSTDEAARMPGPTLTNDVVTRLLRGLDAEKRAQDQAAQAMERQRVADSVAELERKKPGHYTSREECVGVKFQEDPKQADLQRLMQQASAAAEKKDMNLAMQLSQRMAPMQLEIQQRAESSCAKVPTMAEVMAKAPKPEERAVMLGRDSLEVIGANGGGFNRGEYAQLKELVYTYLSYPQKAGLAPAEKQVVDPKKAELRQALKAIGMM